MIETQFLYLSISHMDQLSLDRTLLFECSGSGEKLSCSQTEQDQDEQASLGEERTILLIPALVRPSAIVAVWVAITFGRAEDALVGAILARHTVRILDIREFNVTFVFAEIHVHVAAVLTQCLMFSTTR